MPKISCGLLIYRKVGPDYEFFLCHPGGPLYAKKDEACWSIPKGEVETGEQYLSAAFRETFEETGQKIPSDISTFALTPSRTSTKIYHAWAVNFDIDPKICKSNYFTLFGKQYPEIDRYGWFSYEQAQLKISPALISFLKQFHEQHPS